MQSTVNPESHGPTPKHRGSSIKGPTQLKGYKEALGPPQRQGGTLMWAHGGLARELWQIVRVGCPVISKIGHCIMCGLIRDYHEVLTGKYNNLVAGDSRL